MIIPAGSRQTSFEKLSIELGMSVKAVRIAMEKCELSGEVKRHRARYGQVVSLVKWDQLQSESENGAIYATGKGQEEGQDVGNERATTKEVKKNKKLRNKEKISFPLFWNLYDKKVDRPKCETKWDRLTVEDQHAIMEYIPGYIKSQPDKKYRKNPLTFLNNRSWENELIHSSEGDEYKTYTYNELLSLNQFQGRYKEFFKVVRKDTQGRAIFAHIDDIEKFKLEVLT